MVSILPSSTSHPSPWAWPSWCWRRANVQSLAKRLSPGRARRGMVQGGFPTPVWEKVPQLFWYCYIGWHPVSYHPESSQDLGTRAYSLDTFAETLCCAVLSLVPFRHPPEFFPEDFSSTNQVPEFPGVFLCVSRAQWPSMFMAVLYKCKFKSCFGCDQSASWARPGMTL